MVYIIALFHVDILIHLLKMCLKIDRSFNKICDKLLKKLSVKN